MPSISIITVAYNAAETIQSCLESVAMQSCGAEHIIIDGASSDRTMEVVDRYRDYLARAISEPDEGIYDAMNKGLSLVTGEVVGILNADDYYPSDAVLAKVDDIFSDPGVDACYGDLVYVNSSDTDKVTRFWRSGVYNIRKFYWG